MTSTLQLEARNATPEQLVALLNDQQAAKLDVVAPATAITSEDGLIRVDGTVAELTEDGVTSGAGLYVPTTVFDDGLSTKLRIPRDYLRRMRDTGRTDILDGNVNGWLHGRPDPRFDPDFWPGNWQHQPDDRSFLLRLFRAGNGEPGIARALLSNSYALSMDNLDVLTAVLRGVQDAGVPTLTRTSDLTENRMRVRIEAPSITATLPELRDYRSPDGGGSLDRLREKYGMHHMFPRGEEPVIWMGFDLTNSETGGGAYTLTPVFTVAKCTNGWVITEESKRRVHLGQKLGDGHVKLSLDTLRKAGELITAETRDTVASWLSEDYLNYQVQVIRQKYGTPIATPSETVPAIVAGLGFTEDERKGVLDMFITGGQPTAGGLLQAVTAYAQTVADPDRAFDIEAAGMAAMDAAASR